MFNSSPILNKVAGHESSVDETFQRGNTEKRPLATNHPENLFLQKLFQAGMVDDNYVVNEKHFKAIPFPSISEKQKDFIENMVNEKIFLRGEVKSKLEKLKNGVTLQELHTHLKVKFGKELSSPFLMGGLLRFVFTSSLTFFEEAFKRAGLDGIEKMISDHFLEDYCCRFPPDGDFKYLVSSKRDLKRYTNEVVNFFSKKENVPNYVIHSGLSNRIVVTPYSPKQAQKVNDFALISFGTDPLEIDLVFDRSSDQHEHIFYNLAFDLENLQFGTPNIDCWQALVDILSRTLHIRNLDFWGPEAWPLLLSYYLRGYVCTENEKIEILRQRTIQKGIIDPLIKCLKGHHPDDPWAAFLITLQACLFLKDQRKEIQKKIWIAMRKIWLHSLEDVGHPLLKMVNTYDDDPGHIMAKLQALPFFNVPFLKVTFKKNGGEQWLQFKIFVKKKTYYLFLPLDMSACVEGLSLCNLDLMKDAFIPGEDEQLDLLRLNICKKIKEEELMDLCCRLTALFYKQKEWRKQDLDHVRFLFDLAETIFLDPKQDVRFGVVCLKTAYEQAPEDSVERQEIYQSILSHLETDQKNALFEKNFWKLMTSSDQLLLLIVRRLFEQSYVEAMNLLHELSLHQLSPLQKKKLSEQLSQSTLNLIEKGFHERALEMMECFNLFSLNLTQQLDLEKILLESHKGCLTWMKILDTPSLSSLINIKENGLTKQFECLKVLREKFKESRTSVMTLLLLQLLNHMKRGIPEAISNDFFSLLYRSLKAIEFSKPLQDALLETFPTISAWLKERSRTGEIRELFELIEQKGADLKFPKQAIEDYLWSLKKIGASSASIGEFLLKFPLKMLQAEVDPLIDGLEKEPQLVYDLSRAFQLRSPKPWFHVLNYLPAEYQNWNDSFQICIENGWLSDEQLAHYCEKRILALAKTNDPEVLYYIQDLGRLKEVCFSSSQRALVYVTLLEEGLNQFKKQPRSNLGEQLMKIDLLALAAVENTKSEIKTKLFKPLGLRILNLFGETLVHTSPKYLLKRLKLYLNESSKFEEKNKTITPQIRYLLSDILELGKTKIELQQKICQLFKFIHLHFRRNVNFSKIFIEALENCTEEKFIWTIVNDYVESGKSLPLKASKDDVVLFFKYFEHRFNADEALSDRTLFSDLRQMLSKIKGSSVFSRSFFERAMDLAIKHNEISGSYDETLPDLYIKSVSHILMADINEKPYASSEDLWQRLAIETTKFHVKAQAFCKKDKSRYTDFFYYLKALYEKFIKINKVQHNQNWSLKDLSQPEAVWRPVNIVMYVWISLHHLLYYTYFSEYHKEIYPLFPSFYFKRLCWLGTGNMADKEYLVAKEAFSLIHSLEVPGNYKGLVAEMAFYIEKLLDTKLIQSNLKSDPKYAQEFAVKSFRDVQTPNRLQMLLHIVKEIHFVDDLFVFLTLHLRVCKIVAMDPFFCEEKFGEALILLFHDNIVYGSEKRFITPEKLRSIILIFIELANFFMDMFEKYPIDKQFNHLGVSFLVLACNTLIPISALKVISSKTELDSSNEIKDLTLQVQNESEEHLFRSISRLLNLYYQSKSIEKYVINFDSLFDLILKFPLKNKSLRDNIFTQLIDYMKKIDPSGELAVKYSDRISQHDLAALSDNLKEETLQQGSECPENFLEVQTNLSLAEVVEQNFETQKNPITPFRVILEICKIPK